MQRANERLRRLGIREMRLEPLARREVEAPGEAMYGTGQTIRRYFTPSEIVVR